MALTKPPVLPPWAEAGDKVQPTNAELQTGWPLSNTPPARQRWNWILNFLANGVRYLTRRGLPDYGADETYMIGDRVIGDDGKTYRSLQDNNAGNAPSASPLWWERWGFGASELSAELNKLDSKASCRVATTANLAALSGLLTIDGVVLVAGDRVLVKDQTTPSQNGIYVVAAGAWARATDADDGTKLTSGATVPVEAGATQADTLWMLTTDGAITVGVTALTFSAVNGNIGTPGTYNQVTVDAKGRVVAGLNLSLGLPRGYLSGMTTGTNAGSPTTKIDITAGKCRSDDDTTDIVFAAAVTKQLNAAWVAGNNGGLDTGAVAANTGYHVWAIHNPTTGVSDVLFSTSYAAPTMPGGFTKKRWIGWIRTDGSSLIKPYFQRGDIFLWKTPGLDVNGSALSAGAGANYALPVPSGLVVQAMLNVQCSGPDAGVYVHSPEADAMYPATTPTTTPPLSMLSWTNANPEMTAGSLIIPTDTSARIRVDSTSSWTETIYIGTLGWISSRGRND